MLATPHRVLRSRGKNHSKKNIASCLAFKASIAKEGYKMRSMSVFVAPEDEASSFWKRGLKEIVVVVVVVVVVKKRSSSSSSTTTSTTASDIPSIDAFLRARPTRPPATTRPRPFPKNRATFDILREKKKNKNALLLLLFVTFQVAFRQISDRFLRGLDA